MNNNVFLFICRRAILNNPDLLPTTPLSHILSNDFWGTTLNSTNSHGSYRPLCVYSFRLNYLVCGFRPWGYHLVNVLLHVLATALVIRVFRVISPSKSSSVAGLIFACHPIHTEAVSGVVGRADILSSIFFLLSFLCYVQHTTHRDQSGKKIANIQISSVYFDKTKTIGSKIYVVFKSIRNVYKVLQYNDEYYGWKGSFSFGYILGKWTYMWLALMFAAASMLSKESGVTVLAVCAVYDVLRSRRVKVKV